jgi:hypothetical protein
LILSTKRVMFLTLRHFVGLILSESTETETHAIPSY